MLVVRNYFTMIELCECVVLYVLVDCVLVKLVFVHSGQDGTISFEKNADLFWGS